MTEFDGFKESVLLCKPLLVELHHLLPDLVPPIDGNYTINFFYGPSVVTTSLTREKEEKIFLEIFESFNYISKKLGLTEADYLNDERGFTTSIPGNSTPA